MYRNWAKLLLPMLESSIATAQTSGARILFPGNIYNFPPDGPTVLREDTPQRATTRKGAIRVAMEQSLEAAQAQGVHSSILRGAIFSVRISQATAGSTSSSNLAARCAQLPIRARRKSGIRGPICPMSARPSRGSRNATQALWILKCSISRDIGSIGALRSPRSFAMLLAILAYQSGTCHGGSSERPRLLCRSCASCGKCVTSGMCRSGSTIASFCRSSEGAAHAGRGCSAVVNRGTGVPFH